MRKNTRDAKVALITVLVCGIIFALTYLHFQTVRQSYLRGVSDGLNVKSVKDLQNIIVK